MRLIVVSGNQGLKLGFAGSDVVLPDHLDMADAALGTEIMRALFSSVATLLWMRDCDIALGTEITSAAMQQSAIPAAKLVSALTSLQLAEHSLCFWPSIVSQALRQDVH